MSLPQSLSNWKRTLSHWSAQTYPLNLGSMDPFGMQQPQRCSTNKAQVYSTLSRWPNCWRAQVPGSLQRGGPIQEACQVQSHLHDNNALGQLIPSWRELHEFHRV